MRILRARKDVHSFISVRRQSRIPRSGSRIHLRVGLVRDGNPPRARGGRERRRDRIVRIASRGFSVRSVPFSVVALCRARVSHPSNERSNVRSFPHDCPWVSPRRGVYLVLERHTLWDGVYPCFLCVIFKRSRFATREIDLGLTNLEC